MCVVLIGGFEILLFLIKNQHRICKYKYACAVAQTHSQQKREDSFITSLLFSFFVC